MPETLNGMIERVTYHNPENGFAVLRVKVKGREDLVASCLKAEEEEAA